MSRVDVKTVSDTRCTSGETSAPVGSQRQAPLSHNLSVKEEDVWDQFKEMRREQSTAQHPSMLFHASITYQCGHACSSTLSCVDEKTKFKKSMYCMV